MFAVEGHRHLFTYDRWANAEILQSLRVLEEPPPRAVKLLAHIIGAQQVWMERLLGSGLPVQVWPDWTAAECHQQFENSAAAWERYLAEATPETLATSITYLNSKGERWESTVEDIATQVAMHGTYHRGQIAAALRSAGVTPPLTDYIEASRRGYLTRK